MLRCHHRAAPPCPEARGPRRGRPCAGTCYGRSPAAPGGAASSAPPAGRQRRGPAPAPVPGWRRARRPSSHPRRARPALTVSGGTACGRRGGRWLRPCVRVPAPACVGACAAPRGRDRRGQPLAPAAPHNCAPTALTSLPPGRGGATVTCAGGLGHVTVRPWRGGGG